MKIRALGWMLLLFAAFASGAAADSCTYTPSPADWQETGRVFYRLVMDRTWLFVPTGHLQIQPIDFTFATGGKVKVVANGSTSPLPLYADPDLTSPQGTEPTYPAGSGFLDYWFWANFQPGTSSVVLTHSPNGSQPVPLNWTVTVQCGSPAGLGVAPETPFEIAGTVGGPFSPASRTYGLTNSGSSPVGYSLSVAYGAGGTGWLNLSLASGSLSAGQSGSFVATVNASAAGLAAGTYAATIAIRTSGASPQTINRAVSLSIQPGTSPPPAISGRITTPDGAPLEGVRMYGLPTYVWTDENGAYSVYVDSGWSGTVQPSMLGVDFSPPTRSYANLTAAAAGEDYTGTATTSSLSGRVTLDGAGLLGVTMTGLPGEPVTDADGNYAATLPFQWSGTVVPSAPGYLFSPDSITYAPVGMNLVDENYLAFTRTVTLSGRVTAGSSGLGGVWMNGLPGAVVTAADGTYSAAVPYGGSGTVTPALSGYVFSPAALDFSNLAADLPGQSFVASPAPPGTARLWIVATTADLNSAVATSLSGDMILVQPGTYVGPNLAGLAPGATLVSAAGADATTLKVLEFRINMNDAVIDGFTFVPTGSTPAVTVIGSQNVRLRDCRIVAPDSNYGLSITDAQDLLIERTVFQGYGGVVLRPGNSSGTLTLRNNQFLTQNFGLTGRANPVQVVLENNLFQNMTGEAVELIGAGSLTTRNNLFVGNGTGMQLDSIPGSIQLTQDTLVGNGIGYQLFGTLSAVLYNAIFQANNHGIDGGSGATLSVHHVLHWQDAAWLYGSVNYILSESTIWQADPRFVNAAAGNYHLAAGSPARGVGQGGVDLGAYGGTLGSAWITPPGTPPTPPALLAIAITGPSQANPGDTLIATAKATFENGFVSAYTTFTNLAQWSSSDPTVLQAQGAGRFLALRPGNPVVTAQSGAVAATLPVTVLAPALRLTASDTADPIAAGGLLTYEVTVADEGVGTARHLQVTAQLDPRTSFVSASPAPDVGTVARWTLGDLQTGQTARISLTVRVDPASPGATLAFSAAATADFAAGVSASQMTAVAGTPDLQIAASLTPATVGPGGRIAGALTYRNAGSATARDTVVEAGYPAGTVFRSATPAPSSGAGTWFVGDLAPGEQRTIALDLQASPSAAGPQALAVVIRSSDADLAPADNAASASVTIVPAADLAVAATVSPDPALVGHPLTYQLTVSNRGPSEATGVTVLAQLPDGLDLVSAAPAEGSCSGASPVACQLGSLPANGSLGLTITGTPRTAGTLQMTSTVSGNEGDPATGDNRFTATTEVLPALPGLAFYTLTPCRVLDTRSSGPALASAVIRIVPVAGRCGVPADAVAVSLNLTAVAPSADGFITLFPGDGARPTTSSVNFTRSSIRTSNAILQLAGDASGTVAAFAFVAGGGQVDLILDVSGFFR